MRKLTIPATCLSALVFLSTACSSGTADVTPTFERPPSPPAAGVTPVPSGTPVSTGSISQGNPIDSDNVGNLRAVATGKLDQPFNSMEWRADGEAVFVATRQAVFALQANAATLTEVFAVPAPASVLDVSAEGKAAVAVDVHTIPLVDTGSDTVLRMLTIDGSITSAHFSPDGKVLAVTLADAIAVQLWDVQKGAKVGDLTGFETAAPAYSAKFGPAGRSLIWYSRAKAQVMDLVTAQLGPSVLEDDFISALALSPVEKVLATAAGADLTLWDSESAHILDVFDLPDVATDMAYSPDGKLLFIATNSGVTALQLPLLKPLNGIDGAMQALAFAPAGDGFATVSREGMVSIYRP